MKSHFIFEKHIAEKLGDDIVKMWIDYNNYDFPILDTNMEIEITTPVYFEIFSRMVDGRGNIPPMTMEGTILSRKIIACGNKGEILYKVKINEESHKKLCECIEERIKNDQNYKLKI